MPDLHPIAAARLAADLKNDPEPGAYNRPIYNIDGFNGGTERSFRCCHNVTVMGHHADCPWAKRVAHYEASAKELSDVLARIPEAMNAVREKHRDKMETKEEFFLLSCTVSSCCQAVDALLRPAPSPGEEGDK